MTVEEHKKENLRQWAENFLFNEHTKHRTPYTITYARYIGYHPHPDTWAYDIAGSCEKCGRIEYTKTFPVMEGEKYQPPLEEIV